jgi:hypothetical protein
VETLNRRGVLAAVPGDDPGRERLWRQKLRGVERRRMKAGGSQDWLPHKALQMSGSAQDFWKVSARHAGERAPRRVRHGR